MTRRVIEWNLPITDISKASTHEKSVRHGHPSTLHLWWARRPLASSRATAFAALIDLPSKKRKQDEIFNFIKSLSPWHTVKSNLSPIIVESQDYIQDQWKDQPPKILDPFSGGGSIPLEALRLGCETYASDLNPLAVLIGKATLEWPQKIADPDFASIVESWAKLIHQEVYSSIGQFYPHDPDESIPIGYLWARTIPCPNPNCQREMPLIKHFWLAKTKSRSIAYKPVVDKEKTTISFQILENQQIDFDPSKGTISRGKARCLICDQVVDAKKIRNYAQDGKMLQKMTIVVLRSQHKARKKYRVATQKDLLIYNRAKEFLTKKIANFEADFLVPNEDLPPIGSLGFSVQLYGMTKWKDLFNTRQLLALVTFLESIKNLALEIEKRHPEIVNTSPNPIQLSKIILTYLTIILGRLADKNANLVVYNAYGEKIEHVFGRTALPMAWDYVELNVFSGANGDWLRQTEWVVRFLKSNCWKSLTTSSVNQASATSLPFSSEFFDAVFTDPPYYDNIPYSDLSDFFYVWFKRALGDIFPTLFATPLTPKTAEIVANKGRQKHPKEFFEEMISKAFLEMNRVLKPEGIVIIVYAHKSSEGWETMLKALIHSGFVVTASWPIHTEMKTRLRAKASAALASSIYLVCRKRPQQKLGYFQEIQSDLDTQIKNHLQRFWNAGIRGGDFFISAIGPAMEILSHYRRLSRYSGETVSFKEQLNFIRSVSTNFLVNKLLQNQTSVKIDNLSQFYLAYRWTFQNSTVNFGDAQSLSQACGVELNQTLKTGLIKKKGAEITVLDALNRRNLNPEENLLVDVMHRSLIAWKEGDEEQLEKLVDFDDNKTLKGFWQYCQAVAECLPQKNTEKQLLEGLLVSKYCIR